MKVRITFVFASSLMRFARCVWFIMTHAQLSRSGIIAGENFRRAWVRKVTCDKLVAGKKIRVGMG